MSRAGVPSAGPPVRRAEAIPPAAAIPAAVFYNYFLYRLKALATLIDDFSLEFLNIVERNFT